MKQDRNKKAFLYYVDWAEAMLELPNALRLKIDDALKRYVLYDEVPTDPEVKYSMFAMMRLKIDKDMKIYSDKCDRISKLRSNAGKNHSGNQYSRLEQMELDTDTDTDTDKKKKELSNESKKSASRFSPPTVEEIQSYMLEKGYHVDAEQFFDFYQSKEWYVGKNKMKDWRAAVRNWERTEKEKLYGTSATNRQIDTTTTAKQQRDAEFATHIMQKLNRRGSLEVTATGEEDYKTSF